jgi:hypothetical protein
VIEEVVSARGIADELLAGLPRRRAHVAAVARSLQEAAAPDRVVAAGWLHDIGYVDRIVRTGLHPIDGARYLADRGWSSSIVSLVAYHTGAEYEARERGLAAELEAFERPSQDDLDLLTWADLTSSPAGEPVTVETRLAEIFDRYPPGDPVHVAVAYAAAYLRECAVRGEKLADMRRAVAESVPDS